MDPLRPGWQRRLMLGATLGIALVAAGYALVYLVVVSMFGRDASRELSHRGRSTAGFIETHLGGVVEHLRGLVNEGASGALADNERWQHALAELRREHGALVRAIAVTGAGLTLTTPEGWGSSGELEQAPAVDSSRRSSTVSIDQLVVGDEGELIHLAIAVPQDLADLTGVPTVISLLIEPASLRTEYLEPMVGDTEDIVVLATSAGQPIAVGAGRGRVQEVWREELPQQLQAVIAEPAPASGGNVTIDGRTFAIGDVSTISVAGHSWRLATIRPMAAVLHDARELLLLCVTLAILSLAAGSALLFGLRRAHGAQRNALRDISHWKAVAEDAQREERWRVIAEEAHEPIVFLDGFRVIGANASAVNELGIRERADLIGSEFLRFIAPEEREGVERRLTGSAASTHLPEGFRARLVTAAGRKRIVDLVVSRINTSEGSVCRVSWKDLTSRERAEALLRAVVRTAPMSVLLTDADGNLIWANQVFTETSNLPADRLVGQPLLPIVDERDWRRARVLMVRASRGRPAEAVLHLRRTDGELLAMAVRAAPVFVGGELYGIILVAFDLAAAPAFAGWERVPDGIVLAQLGSMIAHRLNNDLQALVGVVEQLPPLDAVTPVANRARQLVVAATRQLQQFSVLSRSSSVSLQRQSLGAVVASWRQRVEGALPAEIRLAIRQEVADDVLSVDPGQVTLLLDLALAACRPELQGGGTFEVAVEPSPHAGMIRLAVFDTGSRPADEGRNGAGTIPTSPGRDMVQAVARMVARHHRGVSGAKQSVALGSRIWCDLPKTTGHPAAKTEARVRSAAGVILVADDEELVRSTLAEALREMGLEVEEAADGAEVVARVTDQPERFLLLVLDLVMPVMDGREALQQLRATVPTLPILVSTGYDPSGDPVLASAEVIIKPFGIAEFVARVEEILQRSEDGPGVGGTISR